MLRWFRHHASPIAATALAALLALGGASAAPHADDCHDACLPGAVAHDESAHRFEAAPAAAATHPLHCLVCHWARAFRPHVEISFIAAVTSAVDAGVHINSFPLVRQAIAAQPPLRSPPVSAQVA
jgi:hypothetical protein